MENRTYHRIEVLAKGGMGTVEAVVRRDGSFERLYARKRLLSSFREDEKFRAMFLEEARLAGLIRHAHVVPTVDVGEDDEGPFLVMELVEGISLKKFISSIRDHGPLPLATCYELVRQIASGLHAAHETRLPDGTALNLVHRDLSPSNVLVGFDGVARITDFGVAKGWGSMVRTNTGVLKGKPPYMSPEQFRFEILDRRSDLFTLGTVLFEMCSGVRIHSGADFREVAHRVLNDPPPDISDFRPQASPLLSELFFDLLAKQPEDRPRGADRVVSVMQGLLRDLGDEETLSVAEIVRQRFPGEEADMQQRLKAGLEALEDRFAETESDRKKTKSKLVSVGILAAAGAVASLVIWSSVTGQVQSTPTSSKPEQPTRAPVDPTLTGEDLTERSETVELPQDSTNAESTAELANEELAPTPRRPPRIRRPTNMQAASPREPAATPTEMGMRFQPQGLPEALR